MRGRVGFLEDVASQELRELHALKGALQTEHSEIVLGTLVQ